MKRPLRALAASLALLAATSPLRVAATDDGCPTQVPPSVAPTDPGEPSAATTEGKKVGWVRWDQYETHCFTMHLATRQMLDFTVFGQDAASVTQLGTIDSQFQWREAKFMAGGKLLCFEDPWVYLAEIDFGGFDLPQGQRFGLAKLWLEIPIVAWASVRVGKQTTPFSLEILESGGGLPFMERSLQAFDIGTQSGVAVGGHALDTRLTWAAGLFTNWLADGSEVVVTGRVTGLPLYEEGGRHLFHLELGGRYQSLPDSSDQVQARPATNVGPYFADTGAFTAGGSWAADAALLAISGPFLLQAEILSTWVLSSQGGNPNLWGYYVTASWFPTGETRPYDRKKALPGNIVPLGRWGAAEVAARWFVVDLTSRNVAGGVMQDLNLAASWYIGEMFRIDVNYGRVWLNRFGITGISSVYGFRLQFQI